MPERDSIDVLGVRFDNLTRRRAAEAIASLAKSDGKYYVVKPYSEFMPRAAADPAIRDLLAGAALCLADGVGMLWAAHYLSLRGGRLRALFQFPLSLLAMVLNPSAVRHPIREPMAGVDLTWEMLAALQSADASVYLLGGSSEEAEGARSRIAERFPEINIVGARDGYFKAKGPASDAVVEQVNAARPDALLVAMGFPRQERWIADNLSRLHIHVAIAEGGSFSFVAGSTARGPSWMRNTGLEWLYRLLRQPWRLRRQLALPRFVWLVLRERLSRSV